VASPLSRPGPGVRRPPTAGDGRSRSVRRRRAGRIGRRRLLSHTPASSPAAKGKSLLPRPGRRRLRIHASHRRTLRSGHAALAADRVSVATAVGAEKRTSGSCGLPESRIGQTLLANPDRIRENSPLAYDGTSESLVAANESATNKAVDGHGHGSGAGVVESERNLQPTLGNKYAKRHAFRIPGRIRTWRCSSWKYCWVPGSLSRRKCGRWRWRYWRIAGGSNSRTRGNNSSRRVERWCVWNAIRCRRGLRCDRANDSTMTNKLLEWGSLSLLGHIVLSEVLFATPLSILFLYLNLKEGDLTPGWALHIVLTDAAFGVVVAALFWYLVSLPLLRKRGGRRR